MDIIDNLRNIISNPTDSRFTIERLKRDNTFKIIMLMKMIQQVILFNHIL